MLSKLLDKLFGGATKPPESDTVPNYDARHYISEESCGHLGIDREAQKLRERSTQTQARAPHFMFPTASKD